MKQKKLKGNYIMKTRDSLVTGLLVRGDIFGKYVKEITLTSPDDGFYKVREVISYYKCRAGQ